MYEKARNVVNKWKALIWLELYQESFAKACGVGQPASACGTAQIARAAGSEQGVPASPRHERPLAMTTILDAGLWRRRMRQLLHQQRNSTSNAGNTDSTPG